MRDLDAQIDGALQPTADHSMMPAAGCRVSPVSGTRKITVTERRTIEPIALIIEYLENLIDDAESRVTGRGAILDYGMRIRGQTAEEILRHVRQLVSQQTQTATDSCPRLERFAGLDSLRSDIRLDGGTRNKPAAPAAVPPN